MIKIIDIKDKKTEEAASLMNVLLADEFRLYSKTFRFHYNMNLRDYLRLYSFFETQYDELAKIIDNLAVFLKHNNLEKEPFAEYVKQTHIEDDGKKSISEYEALLKLIKDHETILDNIRKKVFAYSNSNPESGLSGLVTSMIGQHEKIIKMIKTYLA